MGSTRLFVFSPLADTPSNPDGREFEWGLLIIWEAENEQSICQICSWSANVFAVNSDNETLHVHGIQVRCGSVQIQHAWASRVS